MNSSPANSKFSFGHDNRFPKVKKTIDKISYDIPTTKTKRSAGFGIGDRFKSIKNDAINNRQKSPSPDSYLIPTLFNADNTTSTFSNHMRQKTYCFGTGRE